MQNAVISIMDSSQVMFVFGSCKISQSLIVPSLHNKIAQNFSLLVINRLFTLFIRLFFAINKPIFIYILELFKLVVFLFTLGVLMILMCIFVCICFIYLTGLIIGAVVHCVSTSDSEHER